MHGTLCHTHFIITDFKYVFSLSTSSRYARPVYILPSAINKSQYIHDFFPRSMFIPSQLASIFFSNFDVFLFILAAISYLLYVNSLSCTILIILAVPPCECYVERWNKRFSGAHCIFRMIHGLPLNTSEAKHCCQFMDRYPHNRRR